MSISQHVRDLLAPPRKRTRVAIVGASANPAKYGAIILADLAHKGFDVVPIHPTTASLADRPCYPSVAEAVAATGPVQIVDFVVPPAVGHQVLDQIPDDVVLWFQPGSFDAALVQRAQARGGEVIAGPCIMVEAR